LTHLHTVSATPSDLRDWLARQRLTQTDLALICGVSVRCVQFWLAGNRRVPHILRLLMQATDDGRLDLDWLARWVARNQEGEAA